MNKKAFTLIELLAVIVILSFLVLLVGTSVTKILKDTKKELSDVQIEQVKEAAVLWSTDHLNDTINNKELTLDDLSQYLSDTIINPQTGNKYENLKVKIVIEDNEINYVVLVDGVEY